MENELRKKFNLLSIWKPFAPDPTTFSDRMASEELPNFNKIGNDVELAISVSKILESLLKKHFVYLRLDDDLTLGKLLKASYLRQYVKGMQSFINSRRHVLPRAKDQFFWNAVRQHSLIY